jgi:hypothetical protein
MLAPLALRTAVGLAGLLTVLATNACTSHYEMDPAYPDEDEYANGAYPGTSQNAPLPAATTVGTEGAASEAAAIDPNDAEETDPAALATFRPALQPYGTWYDDASYGTVWVPDQAVVGSSFSPYLTGGHWAYTDEGYYWVSDYDWGWAPFHYGRWMWTDVYGWAWIPGARYAPAWVDWRYGMGYVGWGPMYPSWYWRNGVVVYGTAAPTPFVFCPSQHLFSRTPNLVVAGKSASPGLVAGTQPYTPPGRTPGAARPFIGPDPRAAGIPDSSIKAATVPAPANARPDRVAWQPAAASKIAPVRTAAPNGKVAAPALPKPGAPVGRPGYPPPTTTTPTARPPSWSGTRTLPPSTAPTYSGTPTYRPPTTTYRPPTTTTPTYRPPVTTTTPTYRPPTVYSPPSTTYRAPTYSPPSTTYRAPTYSPPATTYRPPSYGGGGGGFGGGGGARPTVKPSTGGGGGGFRRK